MHGRVLLLTLRTFSLTGGIERVCRSLSAALYKLEQDNKLSLQVLSLYDRPDDLDDRYLPKDNFRGFNGKKLKFLLHSIGFGLTCDQVILSHIHLLPIACAIKLASPLTKIIVFAHGTEVWEPLKKWQRGFLVYLCCQVWAVSKFTAERMQAVHRIPERRIRVVNNCLDPFFVPPKRFGKPPGVAEKYGLSANNVVLLTVSRLSITEADKGYNGMIRLMPGLIECYPHARYLLAGQADKAEQERLTQLINASGLAGYVVLTGFVPDVELEHLFLLADVFVMPSKKEGFGVVFIEAAACGCRIIAGNTDGSPDALLSGKLGMLIDPGNQAELIRAIKTCLEGRNRELHAAHTQSLCLQAFGFDTYTRRLQVLLASNLSSALKRQQLNDDG